LIWIKAEPQILVEGAMSQALQAKNSETTERFVAAMGMAATGVSVVTTDGPAGRFGLTVSAVSSVSAEPPLVLACINRKSPAAAAIAANGAFSVNVLAAGNRSVAETFAGRPSAGKPYDFSDEDWDEGGTGLPVLAHAAAIFECEMEQAYDAGTHRIFIGRVIAARQGEAKPLVYCNRAFARVSDY
jgi:flavin reductase (DIM6/NTAB) family NADH-FMN oxidoreductase RutF